MQYELFAMLKRFTVGVINFYRPAVTDIVGLHAQHIGVIFNNARTTWAPRIGVMDGAEDEFQQIVVLKFIFQCGRPKPHHPPPVGLYIYITHAFTFALDRIRADVHPPRREFVFPKECDEI